MIKTWLFRIAVGLMFALPLALVSAALAQADDVQVVPTPVSGGGVETFDCQSCHAGFYTAMASGAHGSAATANFVAVWEQQGSPQPCLSCHTTEGLACEACHNPISAGHPSAPATVNRAAEACGACHKATYLGWQVSRHGGGDLSCVDCHDAHATGQEMKGDTSTLCANCHKSEAVGDPSASFAHKAHVPVGLTCAECHLSQAGTPADPHTMADHSFDVKVETCDACHTSRALVAGEALPQATPTPVDSMASSLTAGVSATPQPVSPVGFATISILVGFGFGVVVAPWLERWWRASGKELFKR